MTSLETPHEQQERRQPTPETGRRVTPLAGGAGLLVVAGIVLRFLGPRDLWLDEALSVNIARLPAHQVLRALRDDGSPPFWYLLLHYWISLFGSGTHAVRAFSGVVSVATLPVAWRLGRRVGGKRVAWAALLLLAGAPFAIRFASETRMYSLVVLEVCLGGLALLRALDAPTRTGVVGQLSRLAPLTLATLALALTHYWSFFLLAVVGVGLLATRRWPGLLAMVAAGVLFTPQVPALLYQQAHTGTPWAPPTQFRAVTDTLVGWGGPAYEWFAIPLGLLLIGLVLVGAFGASTPADTPAGTPAGLVLRGRGSPRGWSLLALSVGTLIVAAVATKLGHAGYVTRYTAVALPAYVLLAAVGVTLLGRRASVAVLGFATVVGLASGGYDGTASRTQAGQLARAIEATTVAGDVVVYCPDQLAPAIHRLLPAGLVEMSYGDPLGPARVDWVDYIARNASLSPGSSAAQAVLAAGQDHDVVLVGADGYLTFGDQCDTLADALEALRPDPRVLVHRDRAQGESAAALLFSPATPAPGHADPATVGTTPLEHRALLES